VVYFGLTLWGVLDSEPDISPWQMLGYWAVIAAVVLAVAWIFVLT
jgi:hypothetical protein